MSRYKVGDIVYVKATENNKPELRKRFKSLKAKVIKANVNYLGFLKGCRIAFIDCIDEKENEKIVMDIPEVTLTKVPQVLRK